MQKHHIDTSVIVEPEKTEDGRHCQKYLNKERDYIQGVVSLPVLGELYLLLLRMNNIEKMYAFQENIIHLTRIHKLSFYTPTIENIKIQKFISVIDNRIDAIDREILACAIEDKASYLVTLDKKLIGNKKIVSAFNIKICHPRDLL